MELDFESPEEAKEFPGLYKKATADQDGMSDSLDYTEEEKKKRKDKKDSKKDKGYATLADENSQDEDDEGNKDKKKSKGFKLSSSKKKEKEPKEKKDKDKDKGKDKKEGTSSLEREVPFAALRMPFSAERHKELESHRSSVPSTSFFSSATTPKGEKGKEKEDKEKEKSTLAFLNAPAPLFLQRKEKSKKDKEKEPKKEKKDKDKKDKEKKEKKDKDKKEKEGGGGTSSVAKVKLKLMRSKNSLDEPHIEKSSDIPVSASHQFPEDPNLIAKAIAKHEQLLEQTHDKIKSSKKVSKKQEEELWELQRTLTALKRKLRSINALSTASVSIPAAAVTVDTHPRPPSAVAKSQVSPAVPAEPPSATDSTSSNSNSGNSNSNTIPPTTSSPSSETITPQPTPPNPPDVPIEVVKNSSGCAPVCCDPQTVVVDDIPVIPPPPPLVVMPPTKRSARRSLDFSSVAAEEGKPTVVDPSLVFPVAEEDEFVKLSQTQTEKEVLPETSRTASIHEQVQVDVHKQEDDEDTLADGDSSVARSEEDEARGSVSSRNEENIGIVVNDTNAMIGSMHEELEAAALVFGPGSVFRGLAAGSKSEPPFGEANDSSDVELIRDSGDEESFIEDMIPDILNLPEFQAADYIAFENEQLQLFNKTIQEEIAKEETELNALIQQYDTLKSSPINESEKVEAESEQQLMAALKIARTENAQLHANISNLKHLVAINRLEEFKLETRLRYLEDKVFPISPITIMTPLPTEA